MGDSRGSNRMGTVKVQAALNAHTGLFGFFEPATILAGRRVVGTPSGRCGSQRGERIGFRRVGCQPGSGAHTPRGDPSAWPSQAVNLKCHTLRQVLA